ncbi:hypothetical protein QNH48_14705 [Neobacillus sp. YX16]|nr:hypothetical protein [Neobacillus sp. YX16]WHZ05793.1 hypothetical protein QNH48_14705 [Neobacillus sp. YX16]
MEKAIKQTFIQIPFETFIEMIRDKTKRKGVQVMIEKKITPSSVIS